MGRCFTVTCRSCRAVILRVERIGDPELVALSTHLRQAHAPIAADAGIAAVLRYYDVTGTDVP